MRCTAALDRGAALLAGDTAAARLDPRAHWTVVGHVATAALALCGGDWDLEAESVRIELLLVLDFDRSTVLESRQGLIPSIDIRWPARLRGSVDKIFGGVCVPGRGGVGGRCECLADLVLEMHHSGEVPVIVVMCSWC